ncbi:hypothetical protein [Prochlorococcus marinus]|uniref:hypothetical protein n=1 Tax=Prochlorococcus marinus TaxID=1219 RepID=UPI0022B383BB|nr:hypothetical protein [Prochlorococcus marinus]
MLVVLEKAVSLNKLTMETKEMEESLTTKLKGWIKNVMKAMGDAIFSEKPDSEPPATGEQPYKDKPRKGLL